MSNQEIYDALEGYVEKGLRELPSDKAQSLFADFANQIGAKIGKTGAEVIEIYFDVKSKK